MLPAGFSASFGSERGLWGQGTYFSTLFGLASTYSYKLAGNAAAAEYKADRSRNVRQVADVLTGNYKVLPPNDQLKVPPEIDDANVARSGLHCICFSRNPMLCMLCFPPHAHTSSKSFYKCSENRRYVSLCHAHL